MSEEKYQTECLRILLKNQMSIMAVMQTLLTPNFNTHKTEVEIGLAEMENGIKETKDFLQSY